jgi:hypothetical protein
MTNLATLDHPRKIWTPFSFKSSFEGKAALATEGLPDFSLHNIPKRDKYLILYQKTITFTK